MAVIFWRTSSGSGRQCGLLPLRVHWNTKMLSNCELCVVNKTTFVTAVGMLFEAQLNEVMRGENWILPLLLRIKLWKVISKVKQEEDGRKWNSPLTSAQYRILGRYETGSSQTFCLREGLLMVSTLDISVTVSSCLILFIKPTLGADIEKLDARIKTQQLIL